MYSIFMGKVQLPVAPSKLQLKVSNANRTITLLNTGEVNLLKTPGLSDISFEVLLPSVRYPFAVYKDGFKEPSFYMDYFERLKSSKEPFQFIVSRFLPNGQFMFDTNIKVSIEDYAIVEDVKDGFDVTVVVKLKQYRDFGTKTITVKSDPKTKVIAATIQKPRPAPAQTPAKTYKVKKGDTLWAICKKYLGNGNKYPEIAKLNGIKNPNLIYPGQVIKLG